MIGIDSMVALDAAHRGWLVAAALAAVLIVVVVGRLARRRFRSWRASRRGRNAARTERAAAQLLEREGYRVIDSQVSATWTVTIDGQPHRVDLRADHLVEYDGHQYIAEVKSGRRAPRITTAATRRQLLEYRCAYPVVGVLLVDMQRVDIRRVDFEGVDSSSPR